jgi:hypothetical protein
LAFNLFDLFYSLSNLSLMEERIWSSDLRRRMQEGKKETKKIVHRMSKVVPESSATLARVAMTDRVPDLKVHQIVDRAAVAVLDQAVAVLDQAVVIVRMKDRLTTTTTTNQPKKRKKPKKMLTKKLSEKVTKRPEMELFPSQTLQALSELKVKIGFRLRL